MFIGNIWSRMFMQYEFCANCEDMYKGDTWDAIETKGVIPIGQSDVGGVWGPSSSPNTGERRARKPWRAIFADEAFASFLFSVVDENE